MQNNMLMCAKSSLLDILFTVSLVPTIRVPNICDKLHFRWPEGVVFGKCQMSFEHTTFAVNMRGKIKEKFKILGKYGSSIKGKRD